MAFLDNSGDIILDAVLTDMGRKRLASGRFTVSKFALGDEEINYELWDPTDARGTAFYDLQIMQTPVLEAFTSDQSIMKSRLLSFSRNDLLYLPILKLNTSTQNSISQPSGTESGDYIQNPKFYVIADEKTLLNNTDAGVGNLKRGYIYGVPGNTAHAGVTTRCIAVDQGIVSPQDSPMNLASPFDPAELKETAFIIKVDNRLLNINTVGGNGDAVAQEDVIERQPQYIDDDYVASYYITAAQSGNSVFNGAGSAYRNRANLNVQATQENIDAAARREVFNGPLGRTIQIVPTVKSELRLSDAVYNELGNLRTNLAFRNNGGVDVNLSNYYAIDTTITVQGMTTGNSIDIPICIIRGKFS